MASGPGWVAQFVGASSHTPKGCGFDSQSGHRPRLHVLSPIRAHKGGGWSVFLSHVDVSLSLSLSLSVPPLTLK